MKLVKNFLNLFKAKKTSRYKIINQGAISWYVQAKKLGLK